MVPLPCAEAREQMVRKNLADRASANLNYEEVQWVSRWTIVFERTDQKSLISCQICLEVLS